MISNAVNIAAPDILAIPEMKSPRELYSKAHWHTPHKARPDKQPMITIDCVPVSIAVAP